jgi:hypothetical protein
VSIEAIAASLRRAAGFECPCPQRVLVQAVFDSLEEIVEDTQFREVVEDTVEALIAYGDLLDELEVGEVERSVRSKVIYAAPPSFICRQDGSVFLIGIAPDHNSALLEKLEKRIVYRNHVRRVTPEPGEDLQIELTRLGLSELSTEVWLKQAPPNESSADYLKRIASKLRQSIGTINELTILNSARSVDHYRRRWEEVKDQTGLFVARRPQAYGNDLWCYVELDRGQAVKLIDLPVDGKGLRGCDEAWRLQLAIDAERGDPQRFRVVSFDSIHNIVEFYSPVPSWASRRWDFIGEPTTQTGALFAYKFAASETAEEIEFMKRRMWLNETLLIGRSSGH